MAKYLTQDVLILGGGITGLVAGWVSGLPVFEAKKSSGGICASYYIKPGQKKRLKKCPPDREAYRFETGGGHWIFGINEEITQFINGFTQLKYYTKKAAVFFNNKNLLIPFPIQNNLHFLGRKITQNVLKEVWTERPEKPCTLKDWLLCNFGRTLCELFFFPFHKKYTAGLFTKIKPEERYKTPTKLLFHDMQQKENRNFYNEYFAYPKDGLDVLIRKIAHCCDMHYEKCARKIDLKNKIVYFEDGTNVRYNIILSSLPLNVIMDISGLSSDSKKDPFTSVLVFNIGGLRGPNCPDVHWIYLPQSKSGLYRIGFYSNIESSFLPISSRWTKEKVSIYAEKAFSGESKPSADYIKSCGKSIIEELKTYGFLESAEVIDPTWVETAYTRVWRDSDWRHKSIEALRRHDIYQIGRYGSWKFQGISRSIKEGLSCLNKIKKCITSF